MIKITNKKYKIDEKINTSPFDDFKIFSQRIAVKFETLPKYISLTPKILNPKENYKVDLLEKDVEKMDIKTLYEKRNELKNKYGVEDKDLGLMWLKNNKITQENIEIIKDLDYSYFFSVENTNKKLEQFKKDMKLSIEIIQKNLDKIDELNSSLKKLKSHKTTEFIKTGIEKNISLDIKDQDLIGIFDLLKVNEIFPFIKLRFEGKTYFKIHENKIPPFEWLQQITRTRSPNEGFMIIKMHNQGEEYADIIWDQFNNVKININFEKDNQDEIEKRLKAFLKPLFYKVLSETEEGVSGRFTLDILNFEKYIFADMIMNNSVVSSVLYMNEFTKPAMEKQKFYIYYFPEQIRNIYESLTALLTINEDNLMVTIQKSRSFEQVVQFISIFSKIISLYDQKKDSIEKAYKKIIKITEKKIKKKEVKRVLKTKQTLEGLQEVDPKMFERGKYSRLVQAPVQPIYVGDPDLSKYGPDDIMEYPKNSGNYYVCRKGDYPFPGLKINNISSLKHKKKFKEGELEEWESEHPYLPICNKTPQITKKDSKYNRYLKSLEEPEEQKETKSKSHSYVKKISDKFLGPDQLGKLPINLKNLMPESENLKLNRYGVLESSSSLLHCMEIAFNLKYITGSHQKRDEIVDQRRLEISKMGHKLNISRQEMPDYTLEMIKEHLEDLDRFLDPNMFIRIVEEFYNCNIFLYEVGPKNPKGTISMPFHKGPYFTREKDIKRKSIVIIKYPTTNSIIPYQCEILQISTLRDVKFYFDQEEEYIELNIKAFDVYNNQYMVSGKNTRKIKPQKNSKFLSKAKSQAIDSNGKTYMLNYDDYSLFVSPCAPLPIPVSYDVKKGKIENLKKMSPSSSEDNRVVFVKTESFEEAYVYVDNIPKNIPINKNSTIYTNITFSKESFIEKVQRNRKIALYLIQYTLYLYSLKGGLTKEDFIVDENYDYKNFESLDKKLFINDILISDDKLIVPSKNTIKKLLYQVKVLKVNNRKKLQEFKNRKIIEGYYQYTSDFKEYPQQLIFMGFDDLLYWLRAKIGGAKPNEMSNILNPIIEDAYFYKDYEINDGKMCIIQNVINGELKRALYVAQKWKENGVNLGFVVPEIEKDIDHVVYEEGFFENKDNNKIGIIKYKNGQYSAMLRF